MNLNQTRIIEMSRQKHEPDKSMLEIKISIKTVKKIKLKKHFILSFIQKYCRRPAFVTFEISKFLLFCMKPIVENKRLIPREIGTNECKKMPPRFFGIISRRHLTFRETFNSQVFGF